MKERISPAFWIAIFVLLAFFLICAVLILSFNGVSSNNEELTETLSATATAVKNLQQENEVANNTISKQHDEATAVYSELVSEKEKTASLESDLATTEAMLQAAQVKPLTCESEEMISQSIIELEPICQFKISSAVLSPGAHVYAGQELVQAWLLELEIGSPDECLNRNNTITLSRVSLNNGYINLERILNGGEFENSETDSVAHWNYDENILIQEKFGLIKEANLVSDTYYSCWELSINGNVASPLLPIIVEARK